MRSQSWFGKLWKRLSGGVVQDVPPSLEECEACREVECTQERWENCQERLATEAARMRAGAAGVAAGAAAPRVDNGVAPATAVPAPTGKPKPVSS